MGDEQNNTLLRKHKNTQNLNEKSNVLRSVFALHNRHISSGSIKEVINSKPDVKSFETFKDIIDELEFELLELQISNKINIEKLDNAICFFEEGSFALISTMQDGSLSLSFKGRRKVEISIDELQKTKKILPGISNSKYQNPGNVVAKP